MSLLVMSKATRAPAERFPPIPPGTWPVRGPHRPRDELAPGPIRRPVPVLYALLYGQGMSKPVTIRVDDELHALLKERAEAEGTTVTALITRAAHDAVRDPRLEGAAEVFRAFVTDNADAFDSAFPEDSPSLLDASGRAA